MQHYTYQNEHLNTQLKKALEHLGESYILHPKYDSGAHPKHRGFGNKEKK